jgi:hypothetical protein
VFGFGKPPAKPLRLIANEADDLPPLAALVQDAALRAGDLSYVPGERHFTVRMNRFCHEVSGSTPLRAPSVLRINCVKKVQVRGIDPARRDQPLSLLAVTAETGEEPDSVLTLHFAGGGRDVRLEVECIDVLLLDLAAPRRAKSRPNHPVD